MTHKTASEWLEDKGLSYTEIDFIETILTSTSTAKILGNKLTEINQTVYKSFPDKKAEIDPNLTFLQFESLLCDNGIFIDINEVLIRYKTQGFCVELCNQLLDGHLIKQ
ncbi:hypothetical protein PGH26_14440 [Sporosarcina jeotgali]|uniref:Uncharacterized protein n=1 Tax=Sporosarcina jeotgali TaxID=3020056 RepID=A0ABZ0KVP8_9BACL|nr:hypothetical protein [Sporosarcina sp. B2O-1]WOV84050.1 hypothetical protein PGH26_14440 [Sporosarcina sp. B2O-1]